MRHALTLALQGYDGAVVTVSHDRHLLEQTVDDYWLVADGAVRPWTGGLSGYREHVRQSNSAGGAGTANAPAPPSNRKAERQARAAERERLKPLTRRIEKLTREIEQLEARRAELGKTLADPSLYEPEHADELKRLLGNDSTLRSQLEQLESDWMEAEQALEQLRAPG